MTRARPLPGAALREFPIFVQLPASDLDRARRWYAHKLGLSPIVQLGGGLLYESGGAPFLLYQAIAPATEDTAAAWVVDDLGTVMADLRAHGVHFEEYAMRTTGAATSGFGAMSDDGAAAWFKDSEGNRLRISQLPFDLSLGDLAAAGRPSRRTRAR